MSTPRTVMLGVYVGPDSVDAVLVRRSGERFEPVQRFSRARTREGELATPAQMATALPGLSTADETDYTLQVGGDWGRANASPGRAQGGSRGDGAAPSSGDAHGGRPFAPALTEILGECAAAGYPDVPVTFCLTAPEVTYLDLLPTGGTSETQGKRGSLKKRLADQVRAGAPQADPDRTAIVELNSDGPERLLGIAVDAADPVTATLQMLEQQAGSPVTARLDSEATLIAALVGKAHATEGERTVVVRVGVEDTLVLWFNGPSLSNVERLRSLSAYDPPETVVSRVLLQQDARKSGDPDTVYVTSTGRLDALLSRFAEFFPDAAVEPLDEAFVGLGIDVPRREGAYRAGALLAAAAAARELSDWDITPDIHLLPAKLRQRSAKRIDWPTVAGIILVIAVLGFADLRYFHYRGEVKQVEEELRINPPVLPDESPDLLQARVDSLNAAFTMYTRSLDVLDSLLVGSDEWTQAMRLVTRTTEASGGTWLTSWSPDGGSLRLSGQSLSRSQIVSLSRRLEGTIEMIEYTDVGPRRVYSFDMLVPATPEMPQIARYLRNDAAARAAGDSTALAAMADTTAFVVDPVGHTHSPRP